jgi:alkylhydroperoxidase/carboxymuconolactone decarboxylase family protein YurZ
LDIMGHVPPNVARIFAMDEDFGKVFLELREIIFRERADGLSLAMKELILVVLDVAVNNRAGATSHLRAARRAGLTQTQLRETLMAIFLILGVHGFAANGGIDLWTSWDTPVSE